MTRFEYELKKLITEHIEHERATLESPSAVKNWEDYKYHLGRQLAFRLVIEELFAEANTNAEKG